MSINPIKLRYQPHATFHLWDACRFNWNALKEARDIRHSHACGRTIESPTFFTPGGALKALAFHRVADRHDPNPVGMLCVHAGVVPSCRPSVPGDHTGVEAERGGLRRGRRATGECLPAASCDPYRPTIARYSHEAGVGANPVASLLRLMQQNEIGAENSFHCKATVAIEARRLQGGWIDSVSE